MGLFDDLNRAGLLAIGLIPEWVDQVVDADPPASDSSGAFLQNSPRAIGYVAAREDARRRTARLTVTVFDLTVSVYNVTIDAVLVTYDASVSLPASNADLISEIAALVDAVSGGLVVNAITDCPRRGRLSDLQGRAPAYGSRSPVARSAGASAPVDDGGTLSAAGRGFGGRRLGQRSGAVS